MHLKSYNKEIASDDKGDEVVKELLNPSLKDIKIIWKNQ